VRKQRGGSIQGRYQITVDSLTGQPCPLQEFTIKDVITIMNNTSNDIHKKLTTEFWAKFGGGKNDGTMFCQIEKLQAVKALAEIVIPRKSQQTLEYRRTRFNRVKPHRHSMKTHSLCFVCGGKAQCRHHLIQLQNGGINSKRNLISICNECHAEVHPWLSSRGE
jgi:hypothetical protein